MPTYEYAVQIPVSVIYSIRDDQSISIDAVSLPEESFMNRIIDSQAGKIRSEVEQWVAAL